MGDKCAILMHVDALDVLAIDVAAQRCGRLSMTRHLLPSLRARWANVAPKRPEPISYNGCCGS